MLSEANESLRGLQEQLSQERQLRKDEVDNFSQKICQVSKSLCPWETAVLSPRWGHLQPQPYDPCGDLGVTWEHTQHVPFSRLSTFLLAHGHGVMQGFPHGTASMALLSPACSQGGAGPQDGDVGLAPG